MNNYTHALQTFKNEQYRALCPPESLDYDEPPKVRKYLANIPNNPKTEEQVLHSSYVARWVGLDPFTHFDNWFIGGSASYHTFILRIITAALFEHQRQDAEDYPDVLLAQQLTCSVLDISMEPIYKDKTHLLSFVVQYRDTTTLSTNGSKNRVYVEVALGSVDERPRPYRIGVWAHGGERFLDWDLRNFGADVHPYGSPPTAQLIGKLRDTNGTVFPLKAAMDADAYGGFMLEMSTKMHAKRELVVRALQDIVAYDIDPQDVSGICPIIYDLYIRPRITVLDHTLEVSWMLVTRHIGGLRASTQGEMSIPLEIVRNRIASYDQYMDAKEPPVVTMLEYTAFSNISKAPAHNYLIQGMSADVMVESAKQELMNKGFSVGGMPDELVMTKTISESEAKKLHETFHQNFDVSMTDIEPEVEQMKQPNTQAGVKAGYSLADAVATAKQGMSQQADQTAKKLEHNPSGKALGAFFKARVKKHFGKNVVLNPKAFGQLKQVINKVGKNRVYRTMEMCLDNWDEFLAYVKQERNWTPDCKVPNMGILLHLSDEMVEFYLMKSGDKDVDDGQQAYQTKDETAQSNKSAIHNIWGD